MERVTVCFFRVQDGCRAYLLSLHVYTIICASKLQPGLHLDRWLRIPDDSFPTHTSKFLCNAFSIACYDLCQQANLCDTVLAFAKRKPREPFCLDINTFPTLNLIVLPEELPPRVKELDIPTFPSSPCPRLEFQHTQLFVPTQTLSCLRFQ